MAFLLNNQLSYYKYSGIRLSDCFLETEKESSVMSRFLEMLSTLSYLFFIHYVYIILRTFTLLWNILNFSNNWYM